MSASPSSVPQAARRCAGRAWTKARAAAALGLGRAARGRGRGPQTMPAGALARRCPARVLSSGAAPRPAVQGGGGEFPKHRPATALLGAPTVGRHRGPPLPKAPETRSAAPGYPGHPRRERRQAGPLRGAARASRSREPLSLSPAPPPPPRRPTSACARGRGAVRRELGSTARRRDPRPASAPRGPAAPAPLPAPHHPALCSPFRFICAPFNFLSPSEKGKANKRASLFLFRACKVEDI